MSSPSSVINLEMVHDVDNGYICEGCGKDQQADSQGPLARFTGIHSNGPYGDKWRYMCMYCLKDALDNKEAILLTAGSVAKVMPEVLDIGSVYDTSCDRCGEEAQAVIFGGHYTCLRCLVEKADHRSGIAFVDPSTISDPAGATANESTVDIDIDGTVTVDGYSFR